MLYCTWYDITYQDWWYLKDVTNRPKSESRNASNHSSVSRWQLFAQSDRLWLIHYHGLSPSLSAIFYTRKEAYSGQQASTFLSSTYKWKGGNLVAFVLWQCALKKHRNESAETSDRRYVTVPSQSASKDKHPKSSNRRWNLTVWSSLSHPAPFVLDTALLSITSMESGAWMADD